MDEAIYEVLTEEQKTRVRQLLKEREIRLNEANEERINSEKLRYLKNQEDLKSCGCFMGFMTVFLAFVSCGIGATFIPGDYIFDVFMSMAIVLTGFSGLSTFLIILDLANKN